MDLHSRAAAESAVKYLMEGVEGAVTVGSNFSIFSISPLREFAVQFADDGESAHFYALNAQRSDRQILDIVNIYTVDQGAGIQVLCRVRINWSDDGLKAILLIDGYPHAVFDFKGKQGYCRTNYPNVPQKDSISWHSEDHQWKDSVLEWFR